MSVGSVVPSTSVVSDNLTAHWDYWNTHHCPQYYWSPTVHRDTGKEAFRIIKNLVDKGLLKVETVTQFISAMDAVLEELDK